MFFMAEHINLRGLGIPSVMDNIMDVQFVDDTRLNWEGNLDNLKKADNALMVFCKIPGALIIWNKSVAFWIGNDSQLQWFPNLEFRWVPKVEVIVVLLLT